MTSGAGMAVIMTSPALAPDAVALIEAAGGTLVYTSVYPDEAAIIALARATDPVAIISRQGSVTAAVMAAAPRLRLVARHGVGVDDVDVAAAHARGVIVTRAPGANARAVAEYTMAVLLALVKRLPAHAAQIGAGAWRGPGSLGGDVAGLRLGLVGAGDSARALVPLATAFGLRVTTFARHSTVDGAAAAPSLAALLAGSDILSLHCPRTPATVGLIDATALATLPAGAYVINAARGGIVDEAALLAALDSGHIAGAALDVFATEPPPTGSAFRHHPAIIVTPHVAGVTPASLVAMGVMAAECVAAVLHGRAPPPECVV